MFDLEAAKRLDAGIALRDVEWSRERAKKKRQTARIELLRYYASLPSRHRSSVSQSPVPDVESTSASRQRRGIATAWRFLMNREAHVSSHFFYARADGARFAGCRYGSAGTDLYQWLHHRAAGTGCLWPGQYWQRSAACAGLCTAHVGRACHAAGAAAVHVGAAGPLSQLAPLLWSLPCLRAAGLLLAQSATSLACQTFAPS